MARLGIFVAIVGVLIAVIALLRDVYDYKIEDSSPSNHVIDSIENERKHREDSLSILIAMQKNSRLVFKRDNSFAGKLVSYKIRIEKLEKINGIIINTIEVDNTKIKIGETKALKILPGQYRVKCINSWGGIDKNVDIEIGANETIVFDIFNNSWGEMQIEAHSGIQDN